jgi:hypothetical protein
MDCAYVPAATRSIRSVITLTVVLVVISCTGYAIAADSGAAPTIALASAEPAQVARGQTVSLKVIHSDNLPIPPDQAIAVLMEACVAGDKAHDSGCTDSPSRQIPCTRENAGDSSCKALIPFDVPTGTYEVRIYRGGPTQSADLIGSAFVPLKVTSEISESPILLGITPDVSYPTVVANGCKLPSAAGGTLQPISTVDLILTGNNFSLAGEDNRILVNDNELKICWKCGDDRRCGQCDVAGSVDQGGREIHITGIPVERYGGVLKVAVDVNNRTSGTKTITISRVQRSTPWLLAAAFVSAIALVLFLILQKSSQTVIAGRRQNLMTALMLDPETDTYSLSKFQFYLWTFAVVLGYSYLSLVRSLIQGTFEFSDVPTNLPGILIVSVGTAVISTGVTSAVGSKGAGRVQPGWADLLTSGGVVAPERVQFVVWTIVGVLSFLALTLLADPGSIQNLPAVPQGFLLLMGVSSAGYLGGKLARKAGPVVATTKGLWTVGDAQSAGSKQSNQKLIVTIIGQHLSSTAGIRFRDLKVTYATPSAATATDNVLKFVTRDQNAGDDSFASELQLTVRDQNLIEKIVDMQKPRPPAPIVGAGAAGAGAAIDSGEATEPTEPTEKPEISVTNPDGQMAAWPVVIRTER